MTNINRGLQAVADEAIQLRNLRGMSQLDLADRSGVARGTISNFERGHHEPRRPALMAIAKALGADYMRWDRMIRGQDPNVSPDAVDLAALLDTQSPELRQVIRDWAMLPEDQQAAFGAAVAAMLAAVRARPQP